MNKILSLEPLRMGREFKSIDAALLAIEHGDMSVDDLVKALSEHGVPTSGRTIARWRREVADGE